MSDESSAIIQKPSEEQLDRDTLFDQVKESTERNRNFFFIWIAFAIYVIATTVATTDLQLLLPNSTVTLPTIGLQLPLIGYFLITPWLVLIIHFNLLHNIDTHAYKLAEWTKHYPNKQPPRALLQAFIFDLAMLEQGATFARLTRVAGEMLCYALGPITIGILLWRFTDYQDVVYTLIHFTAFIASIALTIKARNRLPQFRPESPSTSLKIWPGLRLQVPYFLRTLYRAMRLIGLILTAIVLLETAWVVELTWRKDAWLLNSLHEKLEPFAPRLSIPPKTSLINLDGNLNLRVALDGFQNLKDWWDIYGHGPYLRGRSLQAAVLRSVDMRKADLEGANLQSADLSFAQLNEAILISTQLQGANLFFANLQEAYLSSAELQGAYLFGARLDGADLSFAQLQGAFLHDAPLQGANLPGAKLQGADLSSAELQGANLSGAKLQGADLSSAELQGANLSGAKLQGANLSGVKMQGAIIKNCSVNAWQSYNGPALVLNWISEADNSDWAPILKQIPAKSKTKIIEAWDRAKKQPSRDLQMQLDSNRTLDSNLSMVINGAVPYVCEAGDKAITNALGNWVEGTNKDIAAILADAMLQDISCKAGMETVCKAVEIFEIPIKHLAACNLPPDKSPPKAQ